MVIQRDEPIVVTGESKAGDRVRVRFCCQEREGVADEAGRWQVALDPEEACCEPRELVVISEEETASRTFFDVLVGDVWLASGQSNMEWTVRDSLGGEEELPEIECPLLRLLKVPRLAKLDARTEISAAWTRCDRPEVACFSAVAYYFGKKILSEIRAPIGLIDASWGGTRIEAWIGREKLGADPIGRRVIQIAEEMPEDPEELESKKEYARDPVEWERRRVPEDPGNGGYAAGWARADFDDCAWPVMQVPGKWQNQGHPYSGVFWYRREIDIPDEWAGKDLELQLGACDKHDATYFNNKFVGGMGWKTRDAWRIPRRYWIPGEFVKAGRNVIATRVYSYMTDGGMTGPVDVMGIVRCSCPETRIPIHGGWKYRIEHNFGSVNAPVLPYGQDNPNTPCILYENMIRPLFAAAVRGVIWYQGESNVSQASAYRTLFSLLISDWRRGFEKIDLPFLFVQLANYKDPQEEPVEESEWAELREAQLLTLGVSGTAMAVAIDIGEAGDIHPRNKNEVGRRLALAALSSVYGRDICGSGPLLVGFRVEGEEMRLFFRHAEGGLAGKDPLKGFALAGADGKFFAAEAKIDGQTLILRSDGVKCPTHARYAWANNPHASLFSCSGLPASPFRTDTPAKHWEI